MALVAVVGLLLSQGWPLARIEGAYLAAGLAFLVGIILILGRPAILVAGELVRVSVDCALLGCSSLIPGEWILPSSRSIFWRRWDSLD